MAWHFNIPLVLIKLFCLFLGNIGLWFILKSLTKGVQGSVIIIHQVNTHVEHISFLLDFTFVFQSELSKGEVLLYLVSLPWNMDDLFLTGAHCIYDSLILGHHGTLYL